MNFDDIIKKVEENVYSGFFYTPPIYKKSRSYLLSRPVEIITVYKKEDLVQSFRVIAKCLKKGLQGYCLINYEAGYFFEEKLSKLYKESDEKLIQFFFFEDKDVIELKSSKVEFHETNKKEYSVKDFKLNTSDKKFVRDITRIKRHIKAGDTYQVNYTVKGKFRFSGSYTSLFRHLLFNQSAKYSAFINNGEDIIISLSPEMFFEIQERKITSKPMKGTLHRGINHYEDDLRKNELLNSEKNKAENVMIVDLIRNDLGRICKYGSINVPKLFFAEKYEFLFQMISIIEGRLNKKITVTDVIQNIFPCGSVTGAPKISTMEIIDRLEKEARGIYTGSIGLMTKKRIAFNVAIRTLTINKEKRRGELGIGAGIVWDSDPENEYGETLLKSKFLTEPTAYFEIFETMKVENGEVNFLDEHLTRLRSAADFFLFYFNEKKVQREIGRRIEKLKQDRSYRMRIDLNKWGSIKFRVDELPELPAFIKVYVSDKRINFQNRFQYFKTTNRKLYESEYKKHNAKGFFDVIFLNDKDELAEGSLTNIFLRKGENWFTPPISAGILPGIYRSYLLQTETNVSEKVLFLDDLLNADRLMLVNSVREKVMVNELNYNNDVVEFRS